MRNIHCLNNISAYGTDLLTDDYQLVDDLTQAEGVLVRSAALHDTRVPRKPPAIARAAPASNTSRSTVAPKRASWCSTPPARTRTP